MKTFKKSAVLILFIAIGNFSFAQEKVPSYKDIITENPNAEADIKVVSDYTNHLINNKMDTAEKLLSEKYMSYGPGANDSINKKGELEGWTKSHLVRTIEKVAFDSETFRVTQGEFKGDWVSQWGTYIFTQDSKDISLPYQSTSLVSNGKIETTRIYYDNLSVLLALGYTRTLTAKK